MNNPSLETLKTLSAEDLSQRYKNTYVRYDGKVQYVEHVNIGPHFGFYSEKQKEKEPIQLEVAEQQPQETRSFTTSGINFTRPQSQNDLTSPVGLTFDAYFESTSVRLYKASWFWGQNNRTRDRIWIEIYKYLVNNPAYRESYVPYSVAFWGPEDQREFVEQVRQATGGYDITMAGFWWIQREQNTIFAREQISEILYIILLRIQENFFEANHNRLLVEFEMYRNTNFVPRAFDVIRGQVSQGIAYTEIPTPNYVTERATNGGITFPSRYVSRAYAGELIKELVPLDLSKLDLTRPESRWFLVEEKPYFIAYTNARQFKRGLCLTTANLFYLHNKEIRTIKDMNIKNGTIIYNAAYNHKGIRRPATNLKSIKGTIKEQGFYQFNPYFIADRIGTIFYKTVPIASIIDDKTISLSKRAFRQELEEFIYNPIFVDYGYKQND